MKLAENKIALLQSGLELLLCGFSFGLALASSEDMNLEFLTGDRWLVMFGCALCFWWRLQVDRRAQGLDLLHPVILGTGLVLMLSAFVGYTGVSDPLQLDLIFLGVGFSTLSCAPLRLVLLRAPRRTLLVGCGPVGLEIGRKLDGVLMGLLDKEPKTISPNVPYWGDFSRLEEVLRTERPANVIVELPSGQYWPLLDQLLDYKIKGCVVETASSAYERLFDKIYLPSFRMSDMLWAETQRANRRVMALQAVYSNLIGLTLLLVLSPVLILVGVISWQAARGKGTMFERIECAGFQGIPFQRRRFRVRDSVTGKKTAVGIWIERLGIVELPQIVNLNRGEMGLFGPQPVRMIFSDYLGEVSPLHSHRLSLKPGIFGWEQLHSYPDTLPEEHVRMAYDFYYVEHGSPVMDIEILIRSVLGLRYGRQAAH